MSARQFVSSGSSIRIRVRLTNHTTGFQRTLDSSQEDSLDAVPRKPCWHGTLYQHVCLLGFPRHAELPSPPGNDAITVLLEMRGCPGWHPAGQPPPPPDGPHTSESPPGLVSHLSLGILAFCCHLSNLTLTPQFLSRGKERRQLGHRDLVGLVLAAQKILTFPTALRALPEINTQ